MRIELQHQARLRSLRLIYKTQQYVAGTHLYTWVERKFKALTTTPQRRQRLLQSFNQITTSIYYIKRGIFSKTVISCFDSALRCMVRATTVRRYAGSLIQIQSQFSASFLSNSIFKTSSRSYTLQRYHGTPVLKQITKKIQ